MRVSVFSLVLVAAWGCDDPPATSDPTTSAPVEPVASPAVAAPVAADASLLLAKVKIKSDSGAEVATFKPKEDGAKLVDPAEDTLARYKLKGAKIKVKDGNDLVIAYVKGDATKAKLLAADGEQVRFALKAYDDGRYKLKTDAGDLVYELKPKDYGFKVLDADEKLVFKVKRKGDKSVIRDAEDNTLYATKAEVTPIAFACLGFEKLSWPERGGLFLHMTRVGR